jgi:ribonuclease VapC
MRPRMNKVVLDASALLALLNNEAGAKVVQGLLPEAIISTVNLAEVVTRLSAVGMPDAEIRGALSLLGLEKVVFDEEQAFLTGLLVLHTHSYGLSLGDRACLALAEVTGAMAVTADQAWKDLDIGVAIKLVR